MTSVTADGRADRDAAIQARLRILNVIWAAIAGGLVMLAAVATFLARGTDMTPALEVGAALPVKLALAGAAAALLLIAPVVSRQLLSRVREAAHLDVALQRYQEAVVVGFAMREAVGLVGFVIAVLTGDLVWCYALTGAALLAMFFARPTRETLERAGV